MQNSFRWTSVINLLSECQILHSSLFCIVEVVERVKGFTEEL